MFISLAKKRIEIIDTPLESLSIYDEYRVESGKPDISISISFDDLVIEKRKSVTIEKSFERFIIKKTLDELYGSAAYRKIVSEMIEFETFMMHGSVIATDMNHAYMFTAPSKTGKSTHTKLWLDNLPSSFVVNGDKPLLKVETDQVLACGSPWCGKEGWNTNCIVPLKGIVILERDEHNSIEEISFGQAFPIILQQTYRPDDPEKMKKTLSLLKEMSKHVKFYRMKINNFKDDAFSTSYTMLVKNKE